MWKDKVKNRQVLGKKTNEMDKIRKNIREMWAVEQMDGRKEGF